MGFRGANDLVHFWFEFTTCGLVGNTITRITVLM
jgi:hypothetical protein